MVIFHSSVSLPEDSSNKSESEMMLPQGETCLPLHLTGVGKCFGDFEHFLVFVGHCNYITLYPQSLGDVQ